MFIDLGPHFVRLGALRTRFLRVPGRSGEGFGAPKALFLNTFLRFLTGNSDFVKNCTSPGKNAEIQGLDYKHTIVIL